MRYIAGVLTGFLLSASLAWAALISSPPPLKDKETYLYFRDLWNNMYNMPTSQVNPDGVRRGKYGNFLLLTTGGNSYLEVCVSQGVDGGTVWRGVALSDTP